MKILMIADREENRFWDDWSERTRELLSEVDLVLSAGDLDPDYLEFLVTMLNVPLVYVRGNHDGIYDSRPPEGCVHADGRIVETAGLRILGLGGSMRYDPNAGDMYTEEEMRKRLIPVYRRLITERFMGRGTWGGVRSPGSAGFDILLTHAPCRGHGDMQDLPHMGFECFNGLLERYRPMLHCFGHVHPEYGHFKRMTEHPSGTILINAGGHYIFDTETDA